MHSIFRRSRKRVLPGLALTLLIQGGAFATVIKVYNPNGGTDFDAMKSAATVLTERLESGALSAGESGEVNGFTYQVAAGPLVPKAFSTASDPAYIWSDNILKFEEGFDFRSAPIRFGRKPEPKSLAKSATVTQAIWTTGLQQASLKGASLRLDYTLAQGGPVTLELFGANGKTLQRWTWKEAELGSHTKTLVANRVPRGTAVFIRWSHGNSRMSQRLIVLK